MAASLILWKHERGQYVLSRFTNVQMEEIMAWTTPTLVEICIGLEINGYLPAEF